MTARPVDDLAAAGDRAAARQRDAAAPDRSVWLSANAGSGKTRVLIERVARLLLDGSDPSAILCLTYTKAAAAEMQTRLFRRLGDWAMYPDADLRQALAELGLVGDADSEALARARTLFARAIETPGGLRIQTIHAFCATILRRFPLEAGVNPAFRELDPRDAAALRAEVLDEIIGSGGDGALVELGRRVGDSAFARLVDGLIRVREALGADSDDMDAALALHDGAEAQVLAPLTDASSRATLAALSDLSQASQKVSDRALAAALTDVLAKATATRDDIAVLEDRFLTKEEAKAGPFTAKIGSVPTKDVRAADPALAERVEAIMRQVEAARPLRLALDARDRNRTLRDFARVFLDVYEQRKDERGLLDFDDLIARTDRLLDQSAMAQWVLWRLDGGLDHILVDEAQDTSPQQWRVIERLTEEFGAGLGARPDRRRTLFVVGDPKQSIFSFQGADARGFARMRASFAGTLERVGDTLRDTSLAHSYRSSPAILEVVDQVFADAATALGMRSTHQAVRPDHPGRVDLWPVIPPTPRGPSTRPWTEMDDRTDVDHEDVQLARRVADEVVRMLAEGTRPVRTPDGWAATPITPGDILILLRKRTGVLFRALIQAMKSAGVPMAGADRLALGDSLAVRDIEAVLKVLALPQDDLSLAAALRSPLFGWDEAALYRLAQPRRPGERLWDALVRQGRGPDGPLVDGTLAIWRDLRARADFLRPHELLVRLLDRHDGRRRLIARLGAEAEDAIDALLDQALVYEQQSIPSLTGFLEWRARDESEVQRRVDAEAGLLRVMTVHGAKGLEAPIVILPDTAKPKPRTQPEALLPGPGGPLWLGSRPYAAPLARRLAEAQEAERAEAQRLLYVALTRAESWLIVAGAGEVGDAGDSWYADVRAGMSRLAHGAVSASSHGSGWDHLPRLTTGEAARPSPVVGTDPGPVPPPVHPPGPRRATALGGPKALPGEGGPVDETLLELSLARGTLTHRALELVDTCDDATLLAVLSATEAGSVLPTEEVEAIVAGARRLRAAPDLADLRGGDVLAEVGVSGVIPGLGRVVGQIDALVAAAGRVTILDYKTNQRVPSTPEAVPEGILRQLAAYAALVRPLFPDCVVTAAVVWTATATRMELPPSLLDAALARAVAEVGSPAR